MGQQARVSVVQEKSSDDSNAIPTTLKSRKDKSKSRTDDNAMEVDSNNDQDTDDDTTPLPSVATANLLTNVTNKLEMSTTAQVLLRVPSPGELERLYREKGLPIREKPTAEIRVNDTETLESILDGQIKRESKKANEIKKRAERRKEVAQILRKVAETERTRIAYNRAARQV